MREDGRMCALLERQTHGKTMLVPKIFEDIQVALSGAGRSGNGAAVADSRLLLSSNRSGRQKGQPEYLQKFWAQA